jgi:receptor protein-tyrosine kinase
MFSKPKRRAQRKEMKSDDLSGRLVTIIDPTSVPSEAYRTLRTSLFYTLVDTPPKVIVLTSPGPREGKSTTCANLGVVLAQADKSTLIVDCDFRKPVIHKVFSLHNLFGIVNVLAEERGLERVLHNPLPGLNVVTVGPVPPNPAELLGSRRFAEFLGLARQEFDYVLVDVPPTQVVSDAAIVATQSDGVLLVLDAQNTRKSSFRQSVRGLEAVGANILGTVMNNVKASRGSYYHYGYTYKY